MRKLTTGDFWNNEGTACIFVELYAKDARPINDIRRELKNKFYIPLINNGHLY